jgi:SAM-dependent methyltransferase
MINQETECLLCGGRAIIKHNEYPGYQEPDTYKIIHCTLCNTAFSLPRKDSSEIYENIYKNGDKVPGYSRYWRYARVIKEIADPLDYLAESHEDYWSVREALTMLVKERPSAKILEIGSGLGYLTYALNKAGYNVTGMDVSQTAVNQARENFGDYYICKELFEYSGGSPELFDVVILTEVIEHVSDPLEFIKAIIRLLKPGGRAIITTPNKSFYPAEVIWASDLPPVHCWWLSEESMNYIAGKLGVTNSFINFMGYYKKNYHSIDTRSLLLHRLPKSFFSSDGALIREAGSGSKLKESVQMIMIKSPALHKVTETLKKNLKRLYGKARDLMSSSVIVCQERGHILCTVMVKPLTD